MILNLYYYKIVCYRREVIMFKKNKAMQLEINQLKEQIEIQEKLIEEFIENSNKDVKKLELDK